MQEGNDTKAFCKYFIEYYCNRTKLLAYCYIVNAKINTNMQIKTFIEV